MNISKVAVFLRKKVKFPSSGFDREYEEDKQMDKIVRRMNLILLIIVIVFLSYPAESKASSIIQNNGENKKNSNICLRLGYGTVSNFDTILPHNDNKYLTGLSVGFNYDTDFKFYHFSNVIRFSIESIFDGQKSLLPISAILLADQYNNLGKPFGYLGVGIVTYAGNFVEEFGVGLKVVLGIGERGKMGAYTIEISPEIGRVAQRNIVKLCVSLANNL